MGTLTRIALTFTAALSCAHAQWLNYPTPGTPRTPDGKPDLSAKAPRASNGKPDLSGVWRTAPAPPGENVRLFGSSIGDFVVPGDDPRTFSKYFLDILVDFKPEESPMRPAAAELFKRNSARRGTDSPTVRCLPHGIPRDDIFSYLPFKIIQTPGIVLMMYEVDNLLRQVYTDGRKLPEDPQPAWLGYSVGRWENDTLVVDAAGFNDRTWLDSAGHPHSEDLRVRERFHRRDFGHMDLAVTVEDPKMYAKPIAFQVTELLLPDTDILENVCNENEKDLAHLGNK
jgi:hypothetical protein